MYQTICEIDGMHCGMCESRVNETIRRSFSVKKVSSSHKKKQTVILSQEPLEEAALRSVVEASGYRFGSAHCAPYEKKGLFRR